MTVLDRVVAFVRSKATEGQYRDGPWQTMQGWLPASWGKYANYWQMGYNPLSGGTSAMVEACVSAYAQTIAMCPFSHWRDLNNGGRERVTTSAMSRVLRNPNDYQTRSDFLLNLVRSLYLDGNAYALALRNSRFEITSLHLMNPLRCFPQVYDGEIFYALGGNDVVDSRLASLDIDAASLSAVPARDVLHVKLHTVMNGPHRMLKGETPLTAASLAVAASNNMMAQSAAFYGNMAMPSGVLQTDLVLTKVQVDELRARWNEQAQGLSAGGTPILTSGLKFAPISANAKDAQFAEAMRLTDEQIAEVFRIPLAILGAQREAAGSMEALMNGWISNGLGFALDHVEVAFDKTFSLPDGEYSELDSSVLLRSAFKDRIDGLARGVQGGIYSPNEARAFENLPAAEDGDEPRVQQQVVPLSAAGAIPAAPAAPPAPSGDKPPPTEASVIDFRKYFRELRHDQRGAA